MIKANAICKYHLRLVFPTFVINICDRRVQLVIVLSFIVKKFIQMQIIAVIVKEYRIPRDLMLHSKFQFQIKLSKINNMTNEILKKIEWKLVEMVLNQ